MEQRKEELQRVVDQKTSLLSVNSGVKILALPADAAAEDFSSAEDEENEMTPADFFGSGHRTIVMLFFTMSFFVFFDRGSMGASLAHIQEQLIHDNSFKGGCLASSYLFGYCLASPVFALLGSNFPPMRISSIGMLLWALGTALTGLLSNYYLLICARLLTGVGEASFLCFASTIIDAVSPQKSRAFWLGLFMMSVSFGYAGGYIGGGIIISSGVYRHNDDNQSWRAVFLLEAFIMLPFVLYMAVMKGPKNMLVLKALKMGATDPRESVSDAKPGFIAVIDEDLDEETTPPTAEEQKETVDDIDDVWKVKVKRILTNRTFLCCTMGSAAQTFITGTFGVMGIEYMEKVYDLSASTAGSMFGSATLVSGLLGAVIGGAILDKLKARVPQGSADHFFLKPTLKMLSFCSLAAFPFGFSFVFIHNVPVFLTLLFLCELMIFLSLGPASNAVIWSVAFRDRPLAYAIYIFAIHAFGDSLSPVLVGAIVKVREDSGDSTRGAWNLAMGIAFTWLLLSAFCFFLGNFTLHKLASLLDAPKAKTKLTCDFFDE